MRTNLSLPEKRPPAQVLSAQDVEAILAVPDTTTPLGLRDRAIMEVLYATAIRRSELTNLKLFDVDHGRTIRNGRVSQPCWIRQTYDRWHLHAMP